MPRSFNDMEDWEKRCVQRIASIIGIPGPIALLKYLYTFGVNEKIPTGYIVLGACGEEGTTNIIQLRYGNRILLYFQTLPWEEPVIEPRPVVSNGLIIEPVHVEGDARVVALDAKKLTNDCPGIWKAFIAKDIVEALSGEDNT